MNLFDFNNHLQHNMIVQSLAESLNVPVETAAGMVAKMSFLEYHKLSEAGTAIVPPSGQTIAPTAAPQKTGAAAVAPQKMKAIWPGKGAPVEVGMTVGLKGPNGLPVPGEISQVDAGAKGVKVKNPTTGQDEWTNMDTLEPFMAGAEQGQNIQPGTQPTAEQAQLTRLKELAGIREECSGGATGAGAIAVAPAAMGKVKRRTDPVEESPSLEHPVAGRKTIVGDTKPNQASGKLSANLAVRGKKAAGRTNNGFKK